MKSWNPALSWKTFEKMESSSEQMTLAGTVNKAAILLGITFIAAMWAWKVFFYASDPDTPMNYLWIGTIGGFVVAMITIFVKTISPYTAPLYAALEGLAIGSISAFYESIFPGIAMQSAALTFGTLFCMLIAYRSGAIKATERFKLAVVSATGAICLLYIVNLVLLYFGKPIVFIHDTGIWGVAFSSFVVVIAALNLIMDFAFIAEGVENGCPKYMEWYSAFGLLVTLVWLYLEILRLLSKMRRR